MDRPFVAENAKARERLCSLVERLTEAELRLPLGNDWTIAVALAQGAEAVDKDIRGQDSAQAATVVPRQEVGRRQEAVESRPDGGALFSAVGVDPVKPLTRLVPRVTRVTEFRTPPKK